MEQGPNVDNSINVKYDSLYKIIKDNIFGDKKSNITDVHIRDIISKLEQNTIVIHYSEIPNTLSEYDLGHYFTSKGTLKKSISTKIDMILNGFKHVELINSEDERVRFTSSQLANAPKRVELVKALKSEFKYLSNKGAGKLIYIILSHKIDIKITDITSKYKKLLQYNMSKFDNDKYLHIEFLKYLRYLINGYIIKNIDITELSSDDDLIDPENVNTYDGCIRVNKYVTYDVLKQHVEDECGNVTIVYNFDEPDIPLKTPTTTDSLQRSRINILGNAIKFDFPIQYNYKCPYCDNSMTIPVYKTISTNHKYRCPNVVEVENPQTKKMSEKICNTPLSPNVEESVVRTAYYYNISYENSNGESVTSGAISFDCYLPGYYECVMYKINRPNKSELFHVIGIKRLPSVPMELPKKIENENYLLTLQKACDQFIEKQTNMNIYGLIPIKVALLVQKFASELGERLIFNIQVVGDKSTGKSTVLKYYGLLLNNHLNKSTNGLSISVPGLRGTRTKITIMDTESKIVTKGHLGTFKSIHIDEANDNPELVRQLKAFLYEDNYSYDKAESDGITYKRSSHVNISENLDINHLGQYRGSIKKAYINEKVKIGENDKPIWDDGWDLHLPLQAYEDNIYLKKVIKEKRIEYMNKQVFWIDGYDFALHQRFPFYFYLVNQKEDKLLNDVLKKNSSNHTLSENLQIMEALKTDAFDVFTKKLSRFNKKIENDEIAFNECDIIFKEYGFQFDARTRNFYYALLKISRIVNMRESYNKQDFDLIKYYLETTNHKLDVANISSFQLHGPDGGQEYIQQRLEGEYDNSGD